MRVYDRWERALRAAEADFTARKWKVQPLEVSAPAKESVLATLEKKLGVPIPKQLRDALAKWSSKVVFGWSAPPSAKSPFSHGGLGAWFWNVKTISRKELEGWLKVHDAADKGDFEVPHTRAMWEGHIAFATLPNGDLLTIDASKPDAQPVRYFSHEIEGLHGKVLAPDFETFFTEYTALACPGLTHDDWFSLCPIKGKKALFRAQSPVAQEWLAYLDGKAVPTAKVNARVTPEAIRAASDADHKLLKAAEEGNPTELEAAIAAGPNLDCTTHFIGWHPTAVDFAAKASNLPLLERLVAAGASVHTPENALAVALVHADTKVVSWLLTQGCSANSRSNDRTTPIVAVLSALRKSPAGEHPRLLANLEVLLAAGVDLDDRKNGQPLVGISDVAVPALLRHGVDPTKVVNGELPLNRAMSPAHVKALVDAGVNPNERLPHGGKGNEGRTALQWLLTHGEHFCAASFAAAGFASAKENLLAVLDAMIEAGADPRIPDTGGRDAYQFCRSLDALKVLLKHNFDPNEVDANGSTLLIRLLDFSLLEGSELLAAITYLVREQQIPINAQNTRGDTALHVAAELPYEDRIRTLLALGADKTLKNKKGALPVRRAPRNAAAVKELLAVR